MNAGSRDMKGDNRTVFSCWWTRLLILASLVFALSAFGVTPSLTRRLPVRSQYAWAFGPLVMVADVAPANQTAGTGAFAVLGILILLPIVGFRPATVVASVCGLVAWLMLGIIAAGIGA